jgi:tRNA(Ile)-lysidine synthase
LSITDETVPNEIRLFLQKKEISPNDLMVVAFSGGTDSLAMLAGLSVVREKGSLLAVYVNHRLRSDQELDAELSLNERNCRQLDVPLVVVDLGYGTVAKTSLLRSSGIEEAARTLRYTALCDICKEKSAPYLATAHTCDDQLETVLMRVFQGSPVSALGGIEPSSRNYCPGVTLLRPVLGLSHRQLQDFLLQMGLSWTEDSTNLCDKYFRNSLRHAVSPAIHSLFPQAYKALGRLNQRVQEVSDFLKREAGKALATIDFSNGARVELSVFLSFEPVVRDQVLYGMFDHLFEGIPVRISYAMIQRIREALESSEANSSWSISALGTSARLSQGIFVWEEEILKYQYCLELKKEGKQCIVELPNGLSLLVEQYTESSDSSLIRIEDSRIVNPIIRSPQEGDRISLEGKTVLLSKLFCEWKIPSSLQSSIPVLEDTQGIVAVFARVFGGRDRLCSRCKTPLAAGSTNIYSIMIRNENREI